MRSLRGSPVIVTFLYSTCTDTCPAQAQQVKGALNELGEDVPALAVAVDPPRDDPDRARKFLAKQRMTGRMDFLVGPRPALKRLWSAYAVQPQREDLEHTARLVLVDPKGVQRVSFPIDQLTPERLAHDVKLLARGH
jgi:protein SCO1/2